MVHPKRFTIMWGVSPQPPPVCSIHLDDATAATGQRRQCAHHTPATDGEREIEPIKWMGIIRRPLLTRASGGNLARTPGLHPTLYEKCRGIFNDHRESGPRFNVSSERRMEDNGGQINLDCMWVTGAVQYYFVILQKQEYILQRD